MKEMFLIRKNLVYLDLVNNVFSFLIKQTFHSRNYNYSFALPFILSKIDINPSDLDTILTKFSYGVLIINIIALLCFINVFCYTLTYVFIQKGLKYENKFPTFLKKIINYYKNTTLLFIVLEGILCLICLVLLVYFSLLILYI